MRKKILLFTTVVFVAGMFTACGSSGDKMAESAAKVAAAAESSIDSQSDVASDDTAEHGSEEKDNGGNTSEESSSEQVEDIDYSKDVEGVIAHQIGPKNKNIIVKVWDDESNIHDSLDANGDIVLGDSYSNNIHIIYRVEDNDADAEKLMEEALDKDAKSKLDYAQYSVGDVYSTNGYVWTTVDYGEEGIGNRSVLFVKSYDGKALFGEIQYYTELSKQYGDFTTDEANVEKILDAYGFHEKNSKKLEIKLPELDYKMEKVSIAGFSGTAILDAYAWKDSINWTGTQDENESLVADGEYINGFTSGVRGTYLSTEAYKGTPDARTIVQNYIERLKTFASEGTMISDICGDEKKAYIMTNYKTDGSDGRLTYAVVVGDGYYMNVIIENNDSEGVEYYNDALKSYGLKEVETKNLLELNAAEQETAGADS